MKNNQLYMYTGITSVSNDESNVGFIYVNLKTKETSYISCVGAEEYSAKSAAEGAIQEKGYTAVFPTLVMVDNKPTYFLSLKDKTGLIKAYAFVDVVDYAKAKVSNSDLGIDNALIEYRRIFGNTEFKEALITKDIVVKSIVGYAVNDSTLFYIEDLDNNRYVVDITVSNILPFVHSNDNLTIKCNEDEIATITEIK